MFARKSAETADATVRLAWLQRTEPPLQFLDPEITEFVGPAFLDVMLDGDVALGVDAVVVVCAVSAQF